MKRRHFICEILAKQDFYLFQFKIAELVSHLPIYYIYFYIIFQYYYIKLYNLCIILIGRIFVFLNCC